MTTAPSCPSSFADPADFGTGPYWGQHLSAHDLDGELLSRLEPAKLKDFAALNQSCWFGYRFAHPGHRLMYFIHCYRESYEWAQRRIGKRWIRPPWMKDSSLTAISKGHFTCLVRAMVEADLHGIPYEFYLRQFQEQHLRGTVKGALLPNQLFGKAFVMRVLELWRERNEAGIYTAKCDQLRAENYVGHPTQDAYMDYLCESVRNKGNKAFYVARLMFDVGHLTADHARKVFGPDIVAKADDHR